MALDVALEALRRAILETPREVVELLAHARRNSHVLGVAPHDAQGVDDATQEAVGGLDALREIRLQLAELGEARDRLLGIGGASLGMSSAHLDLSRLDGVLDVHEPTGAELRVDRPGRNELPGLALACLLVGGTSQAAVQGNRGPTSTGSLDLTVTTGLVSRISGSSTTDVSAA